MPNPHGELITLQEAAKRIPGRCHVNTVRRWASSRGHNGIRLKSWRCGRRILTSASAIDDFIAATTEAQAPESVVSSSQQQDEVELDALGVK